MADRLLPYRVLGDLGDGEVDLSEAFAGGGDHEVVESSCIM